MQLTGFELRRAAVIGRALIPASAFGGQVGRTDWEAEIAHQVEIVPWSSVLVFRLALFIAWCGPFLMGYFRFFGALSESAKVEWLERVLKARMYLLRQLMVVLKLFLCLAAMSTDRVLEHVHAYEFGSPVQLVFPRTGT